MLAEYAAFMGNARQNGLRHARRAKQVCVQLVHEAVPWGLHHGPVEVIARVVHQHIDVAFTTKQFAHTSLDRLCARNVKTEQLQAVNSLGLHFGPLSDIDAVVVTLQTGSDCSADAASATCDEDHLRFILHVEDSLSRSEERALQRVQEALDCGGGVEGRVDYGDVGRRQFDEVPAGQLSRRATLSVYWAQGVARTGHK